MNTNMNRFDFNTEGKICDYGCEEPKVLTEQEILEELNHLENVSKEFMSECENLNWQVEYLQEQCDKDDHIDILNCDARYVCHKLNQLDQENQELKKQLENAIVPKFNPHNDLFVIVWKSSGRYEIEQYYIDEIVVRGSGKYIEYRDINQKTSIGENNKLFATKEEAEARLKEIKGE